MRGILDSRSCSASALQMSLDWIRKGVFPTVFLITTSPGSMGASAFFCESKVFCRQKILGTIENSAQEFYTRLTLVLIELCGSLT